MIKRNFDYNVGDIEYSYEGLKCTCKVAGTTGDVPPKFMENLTLVADGTVTWKVEETVVGGGGIKQKTLYKCPSNPTLITTTNTNTQFALSDDPNDYDYFFITIACKRTSGDIEHTSIIIELNKVYDWDCSLTNNNYYNTGLVYINEYSSIGWVCNIYYANTTSYYSGIYLESVVGFKTDTSVGTINNIGTILPFMGNTPPNGYLACDGTEYSISSYKDLAEHFKNEFGSYNYFGGDGINTFCVPDLRGEFLRGTGTNSHTNQGSGSAVGVHQDGTEIPTIGFTPNGNSYSYSSSTNWLAPINIDAPIGSTTHFTAYSKSKYTNSSDLYPKYTVRSTNTSVLYCICYKKGIGSSNSNNSENYSTEEQRIGTWIDGKPLYQKTYITTTPSEYDKSISIIDIDMNMLVLQINGFVYNEGMNTLEIGLWWGSDNYISAYCDIATHSIRMKQHSYNSVPCYITLKYTKTTD